MDKIAQLFFKETILKISKKENKKLQYRHDKAMAKRFGFTSYKKLMDYIEICKSNPDWIIKNGYTGVLSNKEDIKLFLRNRNKFKEKVINYKYYTYTIPIFFNPGILTNKK